MHKQNIIPLAVFFTLVILVAPVFAAGSGFTVTITNVTLSGAEQYTILDIGNNTPAKYTIIANVTNSGADLQGTIGQMTFNFTNVTFILPFGLNPSNGSVCNVTTAGFIGAATNATSNGTYNLTHQACSIGNFSLNLDASQGGGPRLSSVNVTLDVIPNISALTMNHRARGASTVPAMIYAIVNATNNSSGSPASGADSPVFQLNASSFWI